MLSEENSRRFTLVANVAILAGLGLVAFELNQNSKLARSALVNEGAALENQIWSPLMGELPGEIIARAVECPERMTYADYMAMDAYLYTNMNDVFREYELAQEGLFTEQEWKTEVDDYAHWFLGDKFGSIWWEEEGKFFFPEEFSMYVDSQLAQDGSDSYEYWRRIRTRLDPETKLETSASCR